MLLCPYTPVLLYCSHTAVILSYSYATFIPLSCCSFANFMHVLKMRFWLNIICSFVHNIDLIHTIGLIHTMVNVWAMGSMNAMFKCMRVPTTSDHKIVSAVWSVLSSKWIQLWWLGLDLGVLKHPTSPSELEYILKYCYIPKTWARNPKSTTKVTLYKQSVKDNIGSSQYIVNKIEWTITWHNVTYWFVL